ncbi:MAG: cytochrome c maturation protein CcmE [Anaerolineales bacterium]|nr:cytochrome c maturation protein CcmE [Anaerolineales bacterium]MCB8958781.1 cytochrome c maturation protein CcmE [Ardenticatenales bacterium]MCB0005650.1 cytochrome c maturation protein CcmE [Anaerolineales bacterium]MCB0011371.1 cytochrome c maturation protein CcmE [Anaerolineales bacterium]MCB0016319.1 cytochrome c maturation protein CcmE [Anaerolineales bacterium]
MSEASWTKGESTLTDSQPSRLKFVVGAVVIFGAIAALIFSALNDSSQLFKTVDEYYAEEARLVGKDLRIAGWVIGDTIQYTQVDANTSRLEFDIVDDLENPGQRLHVVAMNEPKPELLQNQAQALVDGHVDEMGVLHANPDGLLLKCPTRYEELEPES